MTQKWHQLAQLADLVFAREAAKLADLQEREQRIVARHRKLDALNDKALNDLAQPHPIHWQSGDVLWQTWVSKNARDLNMEQARVRALSETLRPALKRAFGRKLVLAELTKRETH